MNATKKKRSCCQAEGFLKYSGLLKQLLLDLIVANNKLP